MNEQCETCEYFRAVRKWPTYQEVLTHVCTFDICKNRNHYLSEVTKNDMCECYKKAKICLGENI